MDFKKIIETFRKDHSEENLKEFKCVHNGETEYGYSSDKNYNRRKELILALYKQYNSQDKLLIKWLIKEELKGYEFDIPVYTLDLCAFMLYKIMDQHDVYELYDAKFGAGSDVQAHLDIELIFGFDKEETKTYLANSTNSKNLNKTILKTIAFYEDNPNAKFKNREEYIHYFETKKINSILNDLAEFED